MPQRCALELLGDRPSGVGYLLGQRIADGRTNAAIARLSISEKSAVAHTSGIYESLGLAPGEEDHRRVLAVVRYLSACA